jgi:hypothetical protein
MTDRPLTDREYRRDSRLGRRYLVGNLIWVAPAAVAFYFCVRAVDDRGWRFWTPLGAFLICIVFGIAFDWFRLRVYRCPTCGRQIQKPTLEQFGPGTPRCYYCPDCKIEWDTCLRVPDD